MARATSGLAGVTADALILVPDRPGRRDPRAADTLTGSGEVGGFAVARR